MDVGLNSCLRKSARNLRGASGRIAASGCQSKFVRACFQSLPLLWAVGRAWNKAASEKLHDFLQGFSSDMYEASWFTEKDEDGAPKHCLAAQAGSSRRESERCKVSPG